MPRPRPPSRVDAVALPLFGISWFGDPGDGTSIVAHCGGGGSAATGIRNCITVSIAGQPDDLQISTGDEAGVAISVVKNPLTNQLRLIVALLHEVRMYSLPTAELLDRVNLGDNINAIALNSMTDKVAVGCESGTVKIFPIQNDKFQELPEYTLEGHTQAICGISFSPRGDRLVSSAKDGTARVWQGEECLGVLECSILDPRAPPPKRQQQVLVRGCVFGDLEGNLIYTVASGRRFKAFISRWGLVNGQYNCLERTECSPCPISAVSLSGDAAMMALGAVDGSIILWGTERWKPIKKFPEVHDFPVTCIAARPYPVPLRHDELNNVQMHAISASADSQLAWLTLSRKSSKREPSNMTFKGTVDAIFKMAILCWMLYPVANEIRDKCESDYHQTGVTKAWECIRYDVLLAPTTRPGIAVPPY